MTLWYTSDVNFSGAYDVRGRISLHSFSINWRKASRQACSCGESTSTPSTSKMAPRKLISSPYYSGWRTRLEATDGSELLLNRLVEADPGEPAPVLAGIVGVLKRTGCAPATVYVDGTVDDHSGISWALETTLRRSHGSLRV